MFFTVKNGVKPWPIHDMAVLWLHMPMAVRTFALASILLGGLRAQEPDGAQFFESRIRPLLASRCYACHTGARSGGLRLDSRAAALEGGKSGPALVPGKPEESLLIGAITYRHERLTAESI